MSSLFPQQIDVIPFVGSPSLDLPSTNAQASKKIPADVLIRIFDGLDQVERHTGFSYVSAGDTRPDGTFASGSTPGRTLAVIRFLYTVSASQDKSQTILVPWNTLVNESQIAASRPVSCPIGDIPSGNPTASTLTQSPLYLMVQRLSGTILPQYQRCAANLFTDTHGKPNLVISLNYGQSPFNVGEVLSIQTFFLGGA